ncbi:VPS10 domain-containing protein [Flavobacterium sp.]|uniref:VPS10 domain-containing protein n=1 Tax=Flavobacterium sp. TaxID=239 RepID=UPI00286D6F50|nr:glycosyl hydrolase [Flavobacterium sp.]
MKKIVLSFFLLFQIHSFGQQNLFSQTKFKSIGPTIMSGRVVDIAVNESNTQEFYVAYASGGLWYTNNNGNSFEPVMDVALTQNCGAIAVDWISGTIWVGTGEVNSSRSSYSGIGILKSMDKGKSWQNMGLPESHHISKIYINPKNAQEIIVGVLGHLYSKNKERGIYKSIDGGNTWKQTLFVNDETGVIDMTVSPYNSKILFASAWERERKSWNFKGNGINSGIYKSIDGGDNWTKIDDTSGFPCDDGIGRIGLASFNDKIIYAVVDNQNKRPSVKNEIPEDANDALFKTEVIGAEIYVTTDAGTSWKKTHDSYIDDCFYSYGYYFGDITVDTSNQERIYISGVPLLHSNDGGKTLVAINKDNVHADHHVVWINPKNKNHIINGNDGGVNISYDNGKNWFKCNNQAVGQFYAVSVDNDEKYKVYGGLQDNGVWVGPNSYEHSLDWQQEGKYPYEFLLGGDGMQVQVNAIDSNIVYAGSQFGSYYRIDKKNDKSESITPKIDKKEKPLRFNWQTPILVSKFNQDILYLASNFLHRSMNEGKNWEIISPDLTKGKVEGNVPFGTISTISESPFQFGLLYAGTDDGLIHISKNSGENWQKLSDNLPQNLWISRIKASVHKKERVYATLNGYRNDDFNSYVYLSEDYGTTWKSINLNLPKSPVNVIIEDTENENILFVGTDNGLYISMDKGATWQDFSNEIPNVAVHDLVIQKTAKDLIVGTHGRSLYKINLRNIQLLTTENRNKNIILFDMDTIKHSKNWGSKGFAWSNANDFKQEIAFYSKSTDEVTLKIHSENGIEVFNKKIIPVIGLNKLDYDLILDSVIAEKWNKKQPKMEIKEAHNKKYYLPVGKYKVTLKSLTEELHKTMEIIPNK